MGQCTEEKIRKFFGHEKILLPSLGFESGTSRLLFYVVNERSRVRIPLCHVRKLANFSYCAAAHCRFLLGKVMRKRQFVIKELMRIEFFLQLRDKTKF